MKEIKLTNSRKYKHSHLNLTVMVDDEDFEYLNQFKWHAIKDHNTFYAAKVLVVDGKRTTVSLHRFLMNAQKGEIFDHKDGNGLNCQKYNIRKATHSQNMANRKAFGVSKYLGVHPERVVNKQGRVYHYWRARVQKDKKSVFSKFFKTEIDAALAYNEAAKKYHGDFAKLNLITQ